MRRMASVVVVLALLAGLFVATQAPARADIPPMGTCPRGDFCIWSLFFDYGTRWAWFGSDLDYRNNGGADNNAGSAFNNGNGLYVVLAFDDYRGANMLFCLHPGEGILDLADYGMSDMVSGHRWLRGGCPG